MMKLVLLICFGNLLIGAAVSFAATVMEILRQGDRHWLCRTRQAGIAVLQRLVEGGDLMKRTMRLWLLFNWSRT